MCLIASKHRATFACLYPMNLLTWLTAQAAGLGLETDMSPKKTGGVDIDADPNADPTVAPYGVPPHPANEAYVKCMAAVLMHAIGMNLSSITTSENFPWPAIQIRDYFAEHFGEHIEAPDKQNVPKFLLPPSAIFVRAGCSTAMSGWTPDGAIASTKPEEPLYRPLLVRARART